ncbi:ragulator complex protein LAMTOR4-like [Dreissena polymorpha]|uniref:Late endosomal/lysosomal adaptor and MAPK and MTOR activator 4 n=1 Tax=Dreissena polymorpha TaxID=45954 RepID=A0A9D4G4F7_DREPO|nr:ragulator complex protein LAMTOR4-like [Dreissena polymorpha]XP_052214595.1 ragulator complex protein LAMTOR4-like [Dreissena polymorpha]KAH3808528.1 hypothetical protein DPMN_136885 [Dreissena polymorpha]KAH3812607.1 hypothetical protein DPMN_141043 [Dreissena polymorpha]
MTTPFERLNDALGHLVLNEEGAVTSSGGDLENKEDMAQKFLHLVRTALRIPTSHKDKFKRLSVVWDSFMYVITVSNHKIYICKKQFVPTEPVTA